MYVVMMEGCTQASVKCDRLNVGISTKLKYFTKGPALKVRFAIVI